MDRLGDACFRLRGVVMALLALVSLCLARPTPAAWLQGFGLALLGESLRLWAIGYSGEPTRRSQLDAPALITAGPYAWVRNPLYVGNLLNGLGVLTAAFVPWSTVTAWGLWLFVAFYYGFLVRHEEKFLRQLFGAEYDDYRRKVPAWWPARRRFDHPQGQFCGYRSWRFERASLLWWCLIWLCLAAKGWYRNSFYGA